MLTFFPIVVIVAMKRRNIRICYLKKSVKKFIYGKTGTGKSYNFILPIIKEKKELIYITCNNLKNELLAVADFCNELLQTYFD